MNSRTKTMLMIWVATGSWLALVACRSANKPAAPVVAPAASPGRTWGGSTPIAPQYKPQPYVPPQVQPPPPTEQECRARAASAAPVDSSGAADDRQQLAKVFSAHHDTFRCCFDALEAPAKPFTNAKISLRVDIDVAGKLTKAEVLLEESDPISMQTSKCITDIAAVIAYPKPVSGAPVAYKRIFDFKARR